MDTIIINVTEDNDIVNISVEEIVSSVSITAQETVNNVNINVTETNENVTILASTSVPNIKINVIGTDYTLPNSKNPSFTYLSGSLVRIDYASDSSYKLFTYSGSLLSKVEHFLENFSITKNLFYNPSLQLISVQEIIS